MRAPDWLTARPVAHRGLHDRSKGIIENMPGAALAAIEGNFAIECDIQLTADGEAMVHHDDGLGRLTEGSGALRDLASGALRTVRFKDTTERMMSLGDLCALVQGRVPIMSALSHCVFHSVFLLWVHARSGGRRAGGRTLRCRWPPSIRSRPEPLTSYSHRALGTLRISSSFLSAS